MSPKRKVAIEPKWAHPTPRCQKYERAPCGALFFRPDADDVCFKTFRTVRHLRFCPKTSFHMLKLDHIDLRTDPAAASFVKNEQVEVILAKTGGQLISREGINRYSLGDALITGSTGDQWSVSIDRFHTKYDPVPGTSAGGDGKYQSKPVSVLARQMSASFTVARTEGGDLLSGLANDWLLQYAPGDFGIVENARFRLVYRGCVENS